MTDSLYAKTSNRPGLRANNESWAIGLCKQIPLYGIVSMIVIAGESKFMFERLLPHMRVNTIYDIDLQALKKRGIRGIITDLDNTLVGAKEPLATPELVRWLDDVRDSGFKVVIVSNNNRTRVSKFAEPLNLTYIHAARKPANKAFRKALSLLELPAEQTVVIGDQMMTDVLGGNRMGLQTILVNPVSPGDEGVMTRVNRRLEKIALARLRKKGLWPKEDSK
ncbi:YqeG family HAD IIIA-type phosphatase [Paenibacillus sp. GCM10027626]|uniref:YqeG family HAD IIIA-type phosphatase n=1 Tax=Paenibacillus sp. GCM10027626 TaxID=3273411 RepID=UPI003628EC35